MYFSLAFQESHIACANDSGRAEFRFEHKSLELWTAIGRSVVVHDCDNADERFVIVGMYSCLQFLTLSA